MDKLYYEDVLKKNGYTPLTYGWKKGKNMVTLFAGNKVQVWKPDVSYEEESTKEYDTGIIPCTPEQLDILIKILYR